MAQNISLMGADYSAVPAVNLPKTNGGLARFTDVSESTIAAEKMTYGTIGYDANGDPVTGSIIDGDLLSYGTAEKIPSTYQRVEYVIGHGEGSHVDTGISGNDSTLEFDMEFEVDKWAAYRGFFGNAGSEDNNSWRLMFQGSNNGRFYATLGGKQGASQIISFDSSSDFLNKRIHIDAWYLNIEVTVDGVTKTARQTTTAETWTTTKIAFGKTYRDSGSSSSQNGDIKWYYVKIRSAGELIRWYVPCYRKSDNAVGFYDLVNHTFSTSYGKVPFELAS